MAWHSYDTSYRGAARLLRGKTGYGSYALLVAALLAAPFVLPGYYTDELAYLFIVAIASLGLMVLTGFTGQVSLGHAAFMAIGAYAEAWLLAHGVPFIVALPVSGLIAGAVGFVIGLPTLRVSGLSLAMVTLAFASLIELVVGRWDSVTGGYTGISVNGPSLFGFDLGSGSRFYFLCLAVLTLVLLGLVNLMRSQHGRAFVGVRESVAASYGLGIWVPGYKVLAFIVSAALTGLAGALLAHQLQFLTPDAFGIIQSFELLLMVVIGGLGSLRGAILGAILIGLLPTFISQMKPLLPDRVAGQFGLDIFVYGLILGLFVLFEPLGLNGRWLKFKRLLAEFPLYRRTRFRRPKTYMQSERYR
jgi:branched-chain amino acid transport system permease protein